MLSILSLQNITIKLWLLLFSVVCLMFFCPSVFPLCLSSGAARASCTWSFHGRKRTSTSLARTAPLSTACLRSSISTLAASCPSRVRNTCPCSTLWPSGHYSALGQCSAVLTGPPSGYSMACLSGQSPGGSREDEQWHPKTADPDSPHWLADDRPTGPLHTVSYEQAPCCRGLYYFYSILFMTNSPFCYIADWLSAGRHFIGSWADTL